MNKVTPSKPISKMTRLELLRFVDIFAPHRHFYPKTTAGGRAQAETLYQQYLNDEPNFWVVKKNILSA